MNKPSVLENVEVEAYGVVMNEGINPKGRKMREQDDPVTRSFKSSIRREHQVQRTSAQISDTQQ